MPNDVIYFAGLVAAAGLGSFATWWRCTSPDRQARQERKKRSAETSRLYVSGLATDHRTRPYVRL